MLLALGSKKDLMNMDFPLIVAHKDITLKLFNWMDYPKGEPARNIKAFNKNNELLWVIQDLGGGDADCYTHLESISGEIHAINFMCYDCIINEKDGKVISKKFTK
jgi:hypothetical protein